MARKVYFAFHYKDIFRVNVVRNSGVLQDDIVFYDYSLWEEAKSKNDDALKKLINDGLYGTSVTVILLGEETAWRPWVRYEFEKSYARNNGLLAVYIDNIKDVKQQYGVRGSNILDIYNFQQGHLYAGKPLSTLFKTYDWVTDKGYDNFATWVDAAAKQVGK